jgi:hypothetical protein
MMEDLKERKTKQKKFKLNKRYFQSRNTNVGGQAKTLITPRIGNISISQLKKLGEFH